MALPHSHIDVTLPHAPMLEDRCSAAAAFGAKDHGMPPSENSSSADAYQLLHPRTDDYDEPNYGFWGESNEARSSSKPGSSYNKRPAMREAATFCSLWCAFSVIILAAFGIYFAVDLAFSHYGLGTGMVEWIMYRHQLPSSTSYGIKFCLEPPDREAPRPQAWRYMPAGTHDRCTTDTIEFIIRSKETWKVHPGAFLLLGNENVFEQNPYFDRREQTEVSMISQEQVQAP